MHVVIMLWLCCAGGEDGVGVPHNLAAELGLPHLGPAGVEQRRPLEEQLVGGDAGFRRGVAQQPPRLPVLGAARLRVVGGGHDVVRRQDPPGPGPRRRRQAPVGASEAEVVLGRGGWRRWTGARLALPLRLPILSDLLLTHCFKTFFLYYERQQRFIPPF